MRWCLGQHAQRGATKEKTKKLDELKARRKAKDEKKRVIKCRFLWRNLRCSEFLAKNRLSETRPLVVPHGNGDIGRGGGRRPDQQV